MEKSDNMRVGQLFGVTIYYDPEYKDNWKRLCSDALIKERNYFNKANIPISHVTLKNGKLKVYLPVAYDDPRIPGVSVL